MEHLHVVLRIGGLAHHELVAVTEPQKFAEDTGTGGRDGFDDPGLSVGPQGPGQGYYLGLVGHGGQDGLHHIVVLIVALHGDVPPGVSVLPVDDGLHAQLLPGPQVNGHVGDQQRLDDVVGHLVHGGQPNGHHPRGGGHRPREGRRLDDGGHHPRVHPLGVEGDVDGQASGGVRLEEDPHEALAGLLEGADDFVRGEGLDSQV
mmetsp:Transcript_42368/g.99460  ORF Transcript_42368/g.99460 Transcript_42368/m.99460 type:complete len:203 (-) Transcript_42368:616-1224(-)